MKKIGFIGLGIMGKPMAKNLLKAGYSLTVYDIVPERMDDVVKAGAKAGSSSKDVAEKSEVIITMLPNSPDVKEAVLGKNGVLEGAKPGTILIDMSSIAPLASKEVAEKAKEKGVTVLDAPVSGGEPKAIEGTLAIMVGGPQETFDEVEDILSVMGASVTRVGEIGSGNMTKLANQIIVALNIAAMSEAMVLAAKAGVNAEKVFQAIRGGLAGSTVLDAKMPLVLEGNFKPGFRIELHIKDLANALDTAHEVGVPVPLSSAVMEVMQALKVDGKGLSSAVMEVMQALKVDGKGTDDHGGIIQFYEKLAKVQVRQQ
jgi:2-hydroxy-3-oxopropionate reductase